MALVIAIVLWIMCAFSGKLVHTGFRMRASLHLLCFVVAVFTVILLFVFFTCNRVIRMVERVDTGVVKMLMADTKFVEQLQRQISQASKTADVDDLTDYLADNFSGRIASEYPMMAKYLDVNQILKNTALSEQISSLSQGADTAEKMQLIVLATAEGFSKSIKAKVKSVRGRMLVFVIILQAIPFCMAFYSASRYRSQARPKSGYEYDSNDYY